MNRYMKIVSDNLSKESIVMLLKAGVKYFLINGNTPVNTANYFHLVWFFINDKDDLLFIGTVRNNHYEIYDTSINFDFHKKTVKEMLELPYLHIKEKLEYPDKFIHAIIEANG